MLSERDLSYLEDRLYSHIDDIMNTIRELVMDRKALTKAEQSLTETAQSVGRGLLGLPRDGKSRLYVIHSKEQGGFVACSGIKTGNVLGHNQRVAHATLMNLIGRKDE
jgi:hypothetical protein